MLSAVFQLHLTRKMTIQRLCTTFVILLTITTASCIRKSGSNVGSGSPSPSSSPAEVTSANQIPRRMGTINDYANVFDDAATKRLETIAAELLHNDAVEVAFLTVDSTGKQTIGDYSLAVARDWNLGAENHRGMLLTLAIKDRQWRLQVSNALLPELPGEVTKELG
ncbi:MAG: hypothetical protein DMF69_16455, partial [Acidobacteria bacterium]